ncbi:MAG: hypothetical protein ACE14W_08445 [Candidatus Velamenicoccus archaeovorus]
MGSPLRRGLAVAAMTLAIATWASCGGGTGSVDGSSPSPLPSGSLGVVEPGAARAAVEGLCRIAAQDTGDRAAATTVFFDRVHEELHVIAAAAQPRDTDAAARLLEAKERVESDLAASRLPPGFAEHVTTLLGATRGALRSLGLEAPPCP